MNTWNSEKFSKPDNFGAELLKKYKCLLKKNHKLEMIMEKKPED